MYGTTVNNGNVKRTRSWVGESTEVLATPPHLQKSVDNPPVEKVVVEAALQADGTYFLSVEAGGQSATFPHIEGSDLAQVIAERIVKPLSKALATGDFRKDALDSAPQGLGTPVSNKSQLRFST